MTLLDDDLLRRVGEMADKVCGTNDDDPPTTADALTASRLQELAALLGTTQPGHPQTKRLAAALELLQHDAPREPGDPRQIALDKRSYHAYMIQMPWLLSDAGPVPASWHSTPRLTPVQALAVCREWFYCQGSTLYPADDSPLTQQDIYTRALEQAQAALAALPRPVD